MFECCRTKSWKQTIKSLLGDEFKISRTSGQPFKEFKKVVDMKVKELIEYNTFPDEDKDNEHFNEVIKYAKDLTEQQNDRLMKRKNGELSPTQSQVDEFVKKKLKQFADLLNTLMILDEGMPNML